MSDTKTRDTLQPISRLWCETCLDWTQWVADHKGLPLVCRGCEDTRCIDCGEAEPHEDFPCCFDCAMVRMAMRMDNDEWRGSRKWSDEQQPGDDRLIPHGDQRLIVVRDMEALTPDSRRTDRAMIRILETGWDPDFGWTRRPPQYRYCPYCLENPCECVDTASSPRIATLWLWFLTDDNMWRQYRATRGWTTS